MKGLGFYQCSLEWQPSWNYVGRHIHFNKRVEDITRAALRKTFKLGSEDDIPPFIAIHVRHGDFKIACYDTPVDDCFAPLSRYALRVEQVQKQLREEHNVDAKLVLMTSDERNATWWEEVNKLGWAHIDFAGEPQDEILGKWSVPVFRSLLETSHAKAGTRSSLIPRHTLLLQDSLARTDPLSPSFRHSETTRGATAQRGL